LSDLESQLLENVGSKLPQIMERQQSGEEQLAEEHSAQEEPAQEEIAQTEPMQEKPAPVTTETLNRELLEASKKLVEIERGVLGGLQHRVDRSRYYRRGFDILLKEDVRVKRIEGWQPYDAFVRRQLGGSYDFIDLVGQRHDRVQNMITEWTRQLQATELLGLQRAAKREESAERPLRRRELTLFFMAAVFPII
jgi:hypothetical protein